MIAAGEVTVRLFSEAELYQQLRLAGIVNVDNSG